MVQTLMLHSKASHQGLHCLSMYPSTVPTMRGSRGGTGGPDPLKNYKNIGFLSNTGPDPLNNHKKNKPAFNVGPSLARQQNTIEMAFRWQANDGPLLVVFGSPHLKKQTNKNLSKLDPL